MEKWQDFKGQTWKNEVNVEDFIKENYAGVVIPLF